MPPEHFQVTDSALLEPNSRKKLWVNFKPDIDLGHLIAAFTFLGGLGLQWQAVDRRITILEQRQTVTAEQNAETRADLKEIKATINTIGKDLAVSNAVNSRKQ